MIRKEWTIVLVLVALLLSLVVAPLAGAVAGDAPQVEVLLADEGDEDGDDDNEDGDAPGKIALYWMGRNIYYANVPDDAAQDVLDRGFTHVVNTPYLLHENREQWFSAKGFQVIQDIAPKRDDLAITPRRSSPYADPTGYAAKLAALEDYLLSRSDYFAAIADDMEQYPWPTNTYDEAGIEESYPGKDFIANFPDDFENRIGHADAGSSWRTFKNHPSDGTHNVPDLTMENIKYNFPKLSTSHQVVNSRLNLGYFGTGVQVGKLAQTFRPAHDRITRIDILMARDGGGGSGFPLGQVYFYLTETTDDGKPNEAGRLFPVDLRFESSETDYDADGDFAGIEPLSLYFDPEEHGVLDTSKTYALVMDYRGESYPWGDGRAWYVVAADDANAYSEGESFRFLGDDWAPFGSDIWFKVYYPDPPDGWGLREFHEDWIDFQTDVMMWHLEDYRRILDTVNSAKGTSMKLYVYSGYSGEIKDYLDRTWGNQHGGFTTRTFYSVDWDKLASAGLDYAVCGFRYQDISRTLADLAGRAELIGGAQNQAVFNDRWWQCNKKAMLWYRGSYEDGDPRVVVPRGRSPESVPEGD